MARPTPRDDFSDLDDEDVLELIDAIPGNPSVPRGLEKRIAKMSDRSYERAWYLLNRKQSQDIDETYRVPRSA